MVKLLGFDVTGSGFLSGELILIEIFSLLLTLIVKLSLSANDITQLAPLLCVNTNLSQYTTVSGVIGSDALTLEPATTPAIPPNRVEKNPLRFSFSIY
jgi:hypothetical protein